MVCSTCFSASAEHIFIQGGITFSWSSAIVIGTLIVVLCWCPSSAFGNGREQNCPSFQVRPDVIFCLSHMQLTLVCSVYFKHVTVSGVYITMFVKYVSFLFDVAVRLIDVYKSGFIFYSQLYYLPQIFQVALGYSPIRAAVFLLPVLVSQTISSFLAVSTTLCQHFDLL